MAFMGRGIIIVGATYLSIIHLYTEKKREEKKKMIEFLSILA
jgi:hypothetical protein